MLPGFRLGSLSSGIRNCLAGFRLELWNSVHSRLVCLGRAHLCVGSRELLSSEGSAVSPVLVGEPERIRPVVDLYDKLAALLVLRASAGSESVQVLDRLTEGEQFLRYSCSRRSHIRNSLVRNRRHRMENFRMGCIHSWLRSHTRRNHIQRTNPFPHRSTGCTHW